MPYPTSVEEVIEDLRRIKRAYKLAGVPIKVISSIETKALRSGRRQTGEYQSNREPRWQLNVHDPQYGTELDCRIIFACLLGILLEFRNPPDVDEDTKTLLETKYLGRTIVGGTYRDALLLEYLNYTDFVAEAAAPTHGHSNFHIGHQDPTLVPKHVPENIFWRTYRSNLIQGNMTLRQARAYIIKLIARYFELGELDIV
jgi:hypothetical protein